MSKAKMELVSAAWMSDERAMSVLVCTSSSVQDARVPEVVRGLRERGREVFVLDGDRFPLDARLSVELGGAASLDLGPGRGRVDLDQVEAVWITHHEIAAGLGAEIDGDYLELVAAQSELALWDALTACTGALFVDHPRALARVPLATEQLGLAAAAGLEVPATLLTNDPDRVRAFAASLGGEVVAKLVHSSIVSFDDGTGRRGLGAQLLGAAELEQIDRVRGCPQLFQAPIEKARELRVTVVGSQLFTAALEARPGASFDWGAEPERHGEFHPHTLPEVVGQAILRLLDRVGLNFATVDLVVTPEDRHVFLEINPISYFGFVEGATGLGISDALAGLLAGEHPARVR